MNDITYRLFNGTDFLFLDENLNNVLDVLNSYVKYYLKHKVNNIKNGNGFIQNHLTIEEHESGLYRIILEVNV